LDDDDEVIMATRVGIGSQREKKDIRRRSIRDMKDDGNQ